jgi:hypothetical protein
MSTKAGKIIAIIQIVASAFLLATSFFLWSLAHIPVMSSLGINPNWYYINIFADIPLGILFITSIILLVIMNRKK